MTVFIEFLIVTIDLLSNCYIRAKFTFCGLKIFHRFWRAHVQSSQLAVNHWIRALNKSALGWNRMTIMIEARIVILRRNQICIKLRNKLSRVLYDLGNRLWATIDYSIYLPILLHPWLLSKSIISPRDLW